MNNDQPAATSVDNQDARKPIENEDVKEVKRKMLAEDLQESLEKAQTPFKRIGGSEPIDNDLAASDPLSDAQASE